jgi:hypothetical protein
MGKAKQPDGNVTTFEPRANNVSTLNDRFALFGGLLRDYMWRYCITNTHL